MLFHDLRYAFRMLRKDLGFTLVAVLSLALGTGANSAMFSLVDALLLRPLPVARPSEVLTISSSGKTPTALDAFTGISYPEYVDFRDHTKTMEDLVASSLYRFSFSPSPDVLPKVKYGSLVSGNLFQAMGVTPVLGRAFRPDENQVPGRDAVVVLGYDLWKDEFGGDPKAIGRTVRIKGVEFMVIGVAPEKFNGMVPYFKSALFVPAMMEPRLANDREERAFTVKGRLKPGVSLAQAEAEIAAIAKGIEQTHPSASKDRKVNLRTEMQKRLEFAPKESGLFAMLMIMAGLVLLVSCFNVANLLLSRARSRTREVAVRLAMGAGRLRLVRQLLTESLLLGMAGTLAGLWFAWAGVVFFRGRIKTPMDLGLAVNFQLDLRVLIYSLAAGLASVLLFGLAPALQSSRVDLVPALKAADSGSSGKRRLWGRNLLVAAQVAISLVLLLAAATLYRGFSSQLAAGAGFRTSHLMMMSFDPRLVRYSGAQTQEFYRRLTERAALAPGVKSVALTFVMPMALVQRMHTAKIEPEGYQFPPGTEAASVLHNIADEHFFDTLGIRIIRGRGFRAADKGGPGVVAVNEALAGKYWPGQDAVGKRIRVGSPSAGGPPSWKEVVGVAQTGKYVWITEPPTDYLYMSMEQSPPPLRTLIAESYGESASVAAPLREVVRSIDPYMPILDIHTMEEFFQMGVVSGPNLVLDMVGTMGLMALVLATIGLYGLVSYSVSCRTREFGIRIAIGADSARVLGMVLRQGMVLALAGIGIGTALSLATVSLMKSVIFSTSTDWIPYVAVPVLLIAVTLMATYGPARRASRIDPITALRDE